MLQITASPASPFVRKVRLAAAMKSVEGKIELIDPGTDAARASALREANPLNKIPVARLDDGTLVYDSHVICELIDTMSAGPRLFPAEAMQRIRTLTLAALGDGIAEAAILVIYEGRYRPKEKWHQGWVDMQQSKIDAAIDHLEKHVPDWQGAPDYGHLSLAAALGYLDLRFGGRWRHQHPKLSAWHDRFAAAVPAYAATAAPPS